MIDLAAPIFPGQGAAGIFLGTSIELILAGSNIVFFSEQVITPGVGDIGIMRYQSSCVDLWTQHGVVYQIVLHGQYQGKLDTTIGIGSTFDEINRIIGPVVLWDEKYIVRGILRGVCFEPEKDEEPFRIAEIYVYEPDWTEDIG